MTAGMNAHQPNLVGWIMCIFLPCDPTLAEW